MSDKVSGSVPSLGYLSECPGMGLDVSAFTIYMKNADGGLEIVELLESDLRSIGPLIQAYLKSLRKEQTGGSQS